MVVSFTPNIALAKPDDSEIAKNWVAATTLQTYNNTVIKNAADIQLLSYTPTLTAQTTPPNVGAGAVRGEYMDVQGFIIGTAVIEFLSPGIVIGSGEYGISLPAVADNTYHNVGTALNSSTGTFSCIGEGYIYDDSNVSLSGPVALDVVTITGVSYVRMVTGTFAAPVKTSRVYRDAMPSNVSNLDRWNLSFFYKKL